MSLDTLFQNTNTTQDEIRLLELKEKKNHSTMYHFSYGYTLFNIPNENIELYRSFIYDILGIDFIVNKLCDKSRIIQSLQRYVLKPEYLTKRKYYLKYNLAKNIIKDIFGIDGPYNTYSEEDDDQLYIEILEELSYLTEND